MGILMESSQVNIERASYYSGGKCGEGAEQPLALVVRPAYWKLLRPEPGAGSMPPPKKKWIRNYMEEEPSCSPTVLPHHNGIRVGPPPASAPIAVPSPSLHGVFPASLSALPTLLTDSGSELPRARSNSNGSSGPRAGTREVHNKLEKNRRAHLKECFEALRFQLPSSPDDKKSSNLSILDSAIKYIQVLKRRDKELEHEKERIVKEMIGNQHKLQILNGDSPGHQRQRHLTNHDRESSMEVDETVSSRISPLLLSPSPNNSVPYAHSTNMDISITSRTSPISRLSPPSIQSPTNITLDLTTRSTRLGQTSPKQIHMHSNPNTAVFSHISSSPVPTISQRTQAAQIIGSFPQHNGIVSNSKTLNLSLGSIRGTKVGSAPSTLPALTVTSINPGSVVSVNQTHSLKQEHIHNPSQSFSSVMSAGVNGQTAIIHPSQLQLSQVMNGGGLVVNPRIQLFSAPSQSLRVIQTQGGALASIDLPSTAANSPIQRMRDTQQISEPGVGVSGVNGMRGSGDKRSGHHHIAIKPQPNLNSSLRTTNTQGGVTHMMNGLAPLVVSQGGGTHLMTTPSHIAGKVMGGSLMNAHYLSNATVVKPVVVVSTTSNGVPPTSPTSSSSS